MKRERKISLSYKPNTEFVRRLASRWFATEDKARKHSEVADGSGISEGNRMSQPHDDRNKDGYVGNYKADTPTTSQTPHLIADYGILGISDDEDSAKWASNEMKKAAGNQEKTTTGEIQGIKIAQNVTPVANMPKQISTKDSSQVLQTSVKIASANTVGENGTKMKDLQASNENTKGRANSPVVMSQSTNLPKSGKAPENATLAVDGSELNNMVSKSTQAVVMTHNTTMNITLANVQLVHKSDTTANHTGEQPTASQGIGIRIQNASIPNTAVYQQASEVTQNNASGNTTSESNLKTEDTKTASTSLLPQTNQTQSNEQISPQATAPSLEINVTSLRKEQSFDLQLPTSIPSKGSYQDNHFHLEPNDTFKSSEYSPKDLESNSTNSYFLNVTLDKVIAEEQEKGRQSNKLLKKLNSEVIDSRAEPLTNSANLGGEVTDETFREESPAGRTFSENLVEPTSNDALLDRRPSSPQMRESQAEIQQDESLARALNSSSVSSVIFSANRAIFDTDKEEFSKKSAQGRLYYKDKEHRNKRSTLLQHLTKNHRKNSLVSSTVSPRKSRALRKHRKRHRDVTARQVINLGNHFLWFGSQGSADANGFPRHNTATENTPYNVNGYISNFLNTAKGNEAASATKGYKALQSAISSMESNQDGQVDPSISDSLYAVPNNQEWQDSDHGQTPASAVIQDNIGKPIYQGVVDIAKINKTKSDDSVSSASGSQDNVTINGQKNEALNKENASVHAQPEQDSLKDTHTSSHNAPPGVINSSNPIVSHQDSSNDGNQTVIQNVEGSTDHIDDTNSTSPREGTSDQHIQEIKSIKQSEQKQNTTQQMQSEVQHLPKSSNETHQTVPQVLNTQEPSAIIKKISTNPQEPETYHVIVNDAGKKITNANGHVTVIISGPTATQASMPNENTLLIPQTNPSDWPAENGNVTSNERTSDSAKSQPAEQDYSTQSHDRTNDNKNIYFQSLQTVNRTSSNNNKTNGMNANQIAPFPLLQEDIVPALKISEGIEEQLKKAQADGLQNTVNSQDRLQNQSKQELGLHAKANQSSNLNTENTETLMQHGHRFVNVGQDLTGNVDGLQMEEVSRPTIQPEQQREQENLLAEPTGGFLEGGEQYDTTMQSQDVPTLNIVLNPMQRVHGSLSVGGKVIPIASAKEGDSRIASAANEHTQQQLDCHADPNNGKTSATVLTCQKKHYLANTPQSFSQQESPVTQGVVYYGNPQMSGSPALQLDQVMTVLNDQVKATINKEMKTESKDIEKVLTGMTVPSSTLMDTDEAYSQSEPPQRSSLMDADENLTSPPDFERQSNKRRPYHRKIHPFGFPFHFGFPHHFGFPRHFGFRHHPVVPHRRHFWGYKHHSNPLVVMAHKDSDEGFWDYQHNIFIPRDFSHEDESDGDEDNREKHWMPWSHQGHRRGSWTMAHPPLRPHQPRFSAFREPDLVHLRLPTLFNRSGPWLPHKIMTTPQNHKQERGDKRTAVVHNTLRGDRDMCRPIIEGPSPPLKGEWAYLGKVLSSCPCRSTDTEW